MTRPQSKPSRALLALSALALSLLPARASQAPAERPNILFILSDDHAAHAIGCYGSRVNATPALDRLAAQGMRFTRMMVTNSLCAPSRAVLLTGVFNHLNGFTHNGCAFDGSQQTFPKLLQGAGYETALVGKWHLKSQPTGFDYYSVIPGHGKFVDCKFKTSGEVWRDGVAGGEVQPGYLTDVITERAIEWLERREGEQPFLLMVHHKAPHEPHVPAARHAQLYEDVELPEPETLFDDWRTRGPGAVASGNSVMRDCVYPEYAELVAAHSDPVERTHFMYQTYMKGYLRLVASLDENIGRLLDYIDEAGLRENTLVVYTSDNGFFLGDHGFFNKMWMYEEALGVPLIVRWPGVVEASSTSEVMAQNLDFAPLFLEIAELPLPAALQGRSLLPVLRGAPPQDWREEIYYHYYAGYKIPEQYGIRTQRYKLIRFPDHGQEPYHELFDLQDDPRELVNLYTDAEHAELREQLQASLARLRAQYGDTAQSTGEQLRYSQLEHLARGATVSLGQACSERYPGGSSNPLSDGFVNHPSAEWSFDFARWQGFEACDFEALVELPEAVVAHEVELRFLQQLDSWIFAPSSVRIEASSDGVNFSPLEVESELQVVGAGVAKLSLQRARLAGRRVKALRIFADAVKVCPDWHPGAGAKAWLFVDEIIVR